MSFVVSYSPKRIETNEAQSASVQAVESDKSEFYARLVLAVVLWCNLIMSVGHCDKSHFHARMSASWCTLKLCHLAPIKKTSYNQLCRKVWAFSSEFDTMNTHKSIELNCLFCI